MIRSVMNYEQETPSSYSNWAVLCIEKAMIFKSQQHPQKVAIEGLPQCH